ncbi:MAG: hypothetical protein WDW38_001666 [Sanguina aurantia]
MPSSSASDIKPQSSLPEEDTLDETVWRTVGRDLLTIARNTRSVLIPVNWNFKGSDQALGNWDLWGPLLFMLVLASTLSIGESNPSSVFSLVFAEVAIGAVVLTVNVILLGGDIVFFQALCLLGYCLFPIDLAAIVCMTVSNKIARVVTLSVCLAWASWATIPFIAGAVPAQRKALAVFPVMLLYASLGWIALLKTRI